MKIEKHQELIDLTDFLAVSNEYLIRKFKEGGNYLIIDTLGDFLIIERDDVDSVFSTIWSDLYGPIYRRNLSVEEIQRRIDDYYRPYHTALAGALDDAWLKFGMFWHLNCHSMRSFAGGRAPGGGGAVDVCIGDRDGECADREFRDLVVDTFRDLGYRVAVNSPYRGVELVQRYSDPGRGRHSIQIELSRALYMDENLVEPHAGFAELQAKLRQLVQTVCQEARNKAGASREAADAAE